MNYWNGTSDSAEHSDDQGSSVATSELVDESAAIDAASGTDGTAEDAVPAVDGTESVARSEAPQVEDRNGAGVTSTFLRELAHAMQATAEQERQRIADIAAEDGAANIEIARARGLAESDELRRSADADITGIDVWLRAEIEKARREAGQRTSERRAELERHLERHDAIIEAEVRSVDGAVLDFRATLDRFFAELLESTDPSEIAGRAGQLPSAPDLAAVRAAARSSAVAELSGGHDGGGADGGSADADGGSVDAAGSVDAGSASGDASSDGTPEGDAEASADEPRAAARLVRWIAAHTGSPAQTGSL